VLMNGLQCPQEVLGVGGDLFLVRRDLLIAEGGFSSSEFPLFFAFVDFSFRLHQLKKTNIYTPYCKAVMNNCSILTMKHLPLDMLREEKHLFQKKWSDLLESGNPFYNPGIISDQGLSQVAFKVWLSGATPSSVQQHPSRLD